MSIVKNRIFSKVYLETLFIKQNKWHKHGVFLHTLKVVWAVLKAKEYDFLATALFHDIGKPSVAYRDQEDMITGEYSFTNHEEQSYQIVKNWFFLSDWTKDMIRYHYIIRDLKNSKRKGLDKRVIALEKSWKGFDKNFIDDLELFLLFDDYGKR